MAKRKTPSAPAANSPYGDLSAVTLSALTNNLTDTPEDMMSSVEVELEAPEGETEITINPETGEIEISMEPEGEDTKEDEFGKNLAESLDEEVLKTLGREICDWVDSDEEGRDAWMRMIAKGLSTLGVYSADEESAGNLTDIGKISHPLVLEAGTQFQARAMAELYPPNGPVKGQIVGELSREKLAQADRVSQFMNYQLTVEDRGYYDDRDQMTFRLAFTGSEFDKQYYDPVKKANRSRWIKCEDFVVPVHTTSLEDAPRYTQKIKMSHAKFKRMVKAGMYIDADIGAPSKEEETEISKTQDALQGENTSVRLESDNEHLLYECHLDYGFEGVEDKEYDGLDLPYIVTVDKESSKVVGVYRNWRKDDETCSKRIWFTHKKFLPGLGFYGWGLLHTIGGLGDTATQIMNVLLDAGAFSALQGGFKSKDAKLPGDMVIEPGQWQDTEMTAEELSKAFYTPPFRDPSPTLYQLLGLTTEFGRRFAATTEVMTGDASNNGPVGTTVALIEQGSKVFSGIHKRLHKAIGDELIHLAELNYENLPETYPFKFNGREDAVLRDDFDDSVDIVPVSDPNIFSSAQRIAQAQATLQLAQSMPDIANKREAARSLLEAMRVPNVDKIVPEPAEAPYADPISEGAMALSGRPIKAFMTQNHQAHIAVHMQQIGQLQQINPMAAQQMQAHTHTHMAMAYMLQMQQMTQTPMPMLDFEAETDEAMMQDVPQDMEMQISVMASQAVQQMQAQQAQAAQAQEAPQDTGDGEMQKSQLDMQIEDMRFQKEEQRKDIAFANEQKRKDALVSGDLRNKAVETQAEIAMDQEISDTKLQIDPDLLRQAKQYVKMTGIKIPPKKLAAASQSLGKPFSDVVQALSIMMMGGQGAGPAPIAVQTTGNREFT